MTFHLLNGIFNRLYFTSPNLYFNCVLRSVSASFSERNSNKLNVISEKAQSKSGSSEQNTLVGPPHPVSNLRLKVFPDSKSLTCEEKLFYQKSRETQEWNQQYWELHNKDFSKSKESYIQKLARKKEVENDYNPSTEEMADFYKEFLDRNYKKHVAYNWQWYRRNFYLIFLSAKAQFSKLKKSL